VCDTVFLTAGELRLPGDGREAKSADCVVFFPPVRSALKGKEPTWERGGKKLRMNGREGGKYRRRKKRSDIGRVISGRRGGNNVEET